MLVVPSESVVGVVVVVTEQTWSPSSLQGRRTAFLQARRDWFVVATHSAMNGLQSFRHCFMTPAAAGAVPLASAIASTIKPTVA